MSLNIVDLLWISQESTSAPAKPSGITGQDLANTYVKYRKPTAVGLPRKSQIMKNVRTVRVNWKFT